MSNQKLKMCLASIAFIATTSCVFAQSATGSSEMGSTSGSMRAMPRSGDAAEGKSSSHPYAGSDLSNSTNSLEKGTASGKGSGPGAGSPNGN